MDAPVVQFSGSEKNLKQHLENRIAAKKKAQKQEIVIWKAKLEIDWVKIYYNSRENSRKNDSRRVRSSEQGRRADALALGADEGRGYRRYASGSWKQASIRGFPNGAIRMELCPCIIH